MWASPLSILRVHLSTTSSPPSNVQRNAPDKFVRITASENFSRSNRPASYHKLQRASHAIQEIVGLLQATRGLRAGLAGLARGLDRFAAATPHQHAVLSDRRGLADEIALLRKETELLPGFHALGDDRHFEAMAKADHRPNDGRRLRISSKIHDESTVDLDFVERKRLQITQ